MSSTIHPASRRRFLRGCLRGVGALAALPFLESLSAPLWAGDPAAAQSGGPPLRQVIVTVAGGTVIESWKPKVTGALGKLPSILRPLQPHAADLLILSGLSHNGRQEGGGNGHTNCAGLHLTGAPVLKWEGKTPRSTISVDQAAAKAVGSETILPSLELGDSSGEHMFSWTDAGERVPYEGGPRQAFDRLFKGRTPTMPSWKRSRKAARPSAPKAPAPTSDDQLIIDAVLDDAKDLRAQVSRTDQRRLDEYLDSVHALEKRIVKLDRRASEEAAGARRPVASGGSLGLPASSSPLWSMRWSENDPESRADYFRIMSDIALLALATDTTRVVTIGVGNDGELWDGVVTVTKECHHHPLEHFGNAEPVSRADPLAREGCRQIHEWYSVLFAEMLGKMKAVDEGGVSLLDNSMVMYTSYMANGGHSTKDYPILIAGRAQGSIRTGRHVAYKQDTPVANLYLAMLDRMGAKLDSFGESNARLPDLT